MAANAKSPVEQLVPPPPPPRRHVPQPHKLLSPSNGEAELTDADEVDKKPLATEDSVIPVNSEKQSILPSSSNGVESSTSTDAQTLYSIRQQMALSLRRMKDLEEQVKTIPELQVS